MRRALPLMLAALLAGAPSAAQTFEEAVRNNVTVAIDACLRSMIERQAPSEVFPAAGFTHRVVDNQAEFGGNASGFTHYYDAPNDTAEARTSDPEQRTLYCTVETEHLGIADTAALVESVVAYRSPDAERNAHGNDPATVCRSWFVSTGAVISVRMAHPDNSVRECVEDGTARVIMEIPG